MHPLARSLSGAPDCGLLDLRARVSAALAGTSIGRDGSTGDEPLSEALDGLLDSNPTIEGQRSPFVIPPRALNKPPAAVRARQDGGPALQRDREALLEIVRYRLAAFAHLKEFIFSNRHNSVVTRRMQALQHAGFITTWEARLSRGGHPRFALPTHTGVHWATEALRASVVNQPHAQLVGFMLRSRTRRPLVLAPNTAPPFLPHHVETSRLAATFRRTPELRIIWTSAWHRPFPNEVHGIAMPQPDAVLVAAGEHPQLLFLEHDRAQESPGSFSKRKTQRYQLLLDLGLARELLGFERFSVLVTVVDPMHRPLERIRALQEVSAAAPPMYFTLAGWAHSTPDAACWFTSATPVQTLSLKATDHAALVSPFSNLGH